MTVSAQIIHCVRIKKLKGIIDLDEISFDDQPLTAILGPNGCGKSTILHALACCYKPVSDSEYLNWKFSNFFTPTNDATWSGSSFDMIHSYRNGTVLHERVTTSYAKNTDRWSPRYEKRIQRNVKFIGIKTCVPRIEQETYLSAIKYQTEEHQDAELIKEKIAVVFNRSYDELNLHTSAMGREYPGLSLNNVRYSSLAMGAGEQRVLEILSAVFRMPKNGLVLIDEIDLLLHTAALKSLIKIIYKRAKDKSLQIIFTTHREAVLELTDMVSIKHIHTIDRVEPHKTYCFSNTTPDAIQRLTGEQERPLEIFVEDDLAKAIVEQELLTLRLKRISNVTLYGAATNCFTLSAGLILCGSHDLSRQLFLLDGDVYVTDEEKMARVNAVLSGTEEAAQDRRHDCISGIREFVAKEGIPAAPEAQLHDMIRNLTPTTGNEDIDEIIELASSINAVDDTHSLVSHIVKLLNIDRAVGLSKIVKAASLSPDWASYVSELRVWLIARESDLVEEYQRSEPVMGEVAF